MKSAHSSRLHKIQHDLLLGRTKLESTVRYLGIEVDDALELAGQTEVKTHKVLLVKARRTQHVMQLKSRMHKCCHSKLEHSAKPILRLQF